MDDIINTIIKSSIRLREACAIDLKRYYAELGALDMRETKIFGKVMHVLGFGQIVKSGKTHRWSFLFFPYDEIVTNLKDLETKKEEF